MFSVDVWINVQESMGSNIIDTILEHLATEVERVIGGRVGIKILSNLSIERRAKASFVIPVKEMGYKKYKGEKVAAKILEAF